MQIYVAVCQKSQWYFWLLSERNRYLCQDVQLSTFSHIVTHSWLLRILGCSTHIPLTRQSS